VDSQPIKKKHGLTVTDMLRRVTVYDRGIMLATGLIGLAGYALTYVTVAAHADRIVAWMSEGDGLSTFNRVLIMGLLLASLVLGVTLFAIFFFRRTRALAMARRIELTHPEFRHSLVTYLEIRNRGARTANERAVARAVGKRAVGRLAEVDPSDMANTQLLTRVAAVVVGFCVVAFISAILSWNTFAVSLERVVWPSSKRLPSTSTRIASGIVPGNVKVLRHSDVTFEATLGGTLPEKTWLVWSDAGSDGREFARRPEGVEPWSWVRRSVGKSFSYHIEAGDARSETYRVDVVAVPLISDVSVRYEYPEYMVGLDARTESGGQITTYKGVKVTITATTNKRIKAAGADPIAKDVLVAADAGSFSASFTVGASGSYHLWFEDTDGFRNPNPVQYPIVANRDLAPVVRIVEPDSRTELAVDDVLSLVVRADDEFGLTSLKVVYELRGVLHEIELPEPRGKSAIERKVLSMRSIGAQPGDRIRYWAVAQDNAPPEPNTGKSEDCFVTIKTAGEDVADDEVAMLEGEDIALIIEEGDPFEALKQRLADQAGQQAGDEMVVDAEEPAEVLAKLAKQSDEAKGLLKPVLEQARKAGDLD